MTFRSRNTAPPPLVGAEVALEMLRRNMKVLTSNRAAFPSYLYGYAFRRAKGNVDMFQNFWNYVTTMYPLP